MTKALRRACIIVLIPLFIWCGFIVAGLFVARLTTPGYKINNVLMEPGTCGFVNYDSSTPDRLLAGFNKIANDTSQARVYAQKCYSAASGTPGCSSLPVQSINISTNSAASCPWSGDRCVGGPFGAFEMDSGWIDSHDDLGINAKPSDRVQARLVNTCSVIHYGDLLNIVPDNTTAGLSDFYQYNLGSIEGVTNYTYQYSTHTVNDEVAYTITSVFANTFVPNGFNVTPSLNTTDADVSFHFFAPNSVTYYAPTNDPFFSASGNFTAADGKIAPDAYIHIMGCTDQRQFRNPSTNASTFLTGIYKTDYSALGFNSAQNATMDRIFLALIFSDTYDTVNGQDSSALQATSKLYQLFSPGLPNNQWQLELQGWFETGLVKFQQYIVDFVNNPSIANDNGLISIITPGSWGGTDKNALQSQCSQQRVQSTGAYQSFSFLGIMIIIIIAPTLIILSWTLSICVNKRKDRRDNAEHAGKRYAYLADGKLNLLRMALEGRGYDHWQETISDIPVRDESYGTIMPVTREGASLKYPKFGGEDANGEVENGVLNDGEAQADGDAINRPDNANPSQTAPRNAENIEMADLERSA